MRDLPATQDTPVVMKKYGLSRAFPKGVLAESAKIGEETIAASAQGRLDLRKKFIFTCDPVTARDYDDALSLETNRQGNRVLGVHIADVSHYVTRGSALDREAYKRSTSVYFCDRVVPMLPETLCNGVCSLVPDADRLAFSVFLTYDRQGHVIGRKFAKSIIRSKARYTYEQVMASLKGGKTLPPKPAKVVREIAALAQQLRTARFAQGALDLEMPEIAILLDKNGELTGLETRPYDESHQMIEECMVAANEAVAKELWANGVKILARFHGAPDPEKVLALRAELRGLGLKVGDITKPKVFAQFLKSIKKHPLYGTISMMVLRSMKRAVYDATQMGHFGLAKTYYAHFTSPIRRYPDLTLHRQLAAYLESRTKAKVPPRILEAWAEHTSDCEEKAAEAERELTEIKKYRYLETQLKSGGALEYEGVIATCLPFGCFVDIPELAVSGLVHVSELSHAFVRFNESDCTLSAAGQSWRAGDRMRIRVVRVDRENRKIDFVPVRERRRK